MSKSLTVKPSDAGRTAVEFPHTHNLFGDMNRLTLRVSKKSATDLSNVANRRIAIGTTGSRPCQNYSRRFPKWHHPLVPKCWRIAMFLGLEISSATSGKAPSPSSSTIYGVRLKRSHKTLNQDQKSTNLLTKFCSLASAVAIR